MRAQEVTRLQQEMKGLQQRIEQIGRERDKLAQSLGSRRDCVKRLQAGAWRGRERIPALEQATLDAEARLETLREQQSRVAEMLLRPGLRWPGSSSANGLAQARGSASSGRSAASASG